MKKKKKILFKKKKKKKKVINQLKSDKQKILVFSSLSKNKKGRAWLTDQPKEPFHSHDNHLSERIEKLQDF